MFCKVAEPAGRKGHEADGRFLGSRVEKSFLCISAQGKLGGERLP